MKSLLRAEARLIVARKRGQYKGHRSSFRKMKRVFLTLTSEEKAQMSRREMSKMIAVVRKQQDNEQARKDNGQRLLDEVLAKGIVQHIGPHLTDSEFINERGVVNVTLFYRKREEWRANMTDLINAVIEFNRHVPRREEIDFDRQWADSSVMLVYLRKMVKKAK